MRATLFSGLLSQSLFRDRYGRPGKGNDKGNVEGMVGDVRRNHMVPIPLVADWESFNAYLEELCRACQGEILRGHTEKRLARVCTGKTHVALGLGLAACQKGMTVSFTTAAALVNELLEARDERRLLRVQKQMANAKLLIIPLGSMLRTRLSGSGQIGLRPARYNPGGAAL